MRKRSTAIKPRRYRKLEWKRAGFKTPRAWAENERLAKALRESGKPALVVMGVDGATGPAQDFLMWHQATNRIHGKQISFAMIDDLISATPSSATINEHRAQLGLPPLPGCDVTSIEYGQGIRR